MIGAQDIKKRDSEPHLFPVKCVLRFCYLTELLPLSLSCKRSERRIFLSPAGLHMTWQNPKLLQLERVSGNHLLQPSAQTRVYLKLVSQSHIQVGFGYLQQWRLHSLSGQPMPVFSTLRVQEGFFMLNSISCTLICVHHQLLETTARSCLVSFTAFREVFIHIKRASSSPGWRVPALSDFPYRMDGQKS